MTTTMDFQNITTTSLVESRLAMAQVFAAAQRSLKMFLPDLSDKAFKDLQTVNTLESLLIGKSNNKIEVILHNINNLQRDCPRLLSVLRRNTNSFLIYRTMQSAKNASDCLVIADGHTSWHKLHYEHPKVVVVFNDKNTTMPLLNRFNEILNFAERAAVTTMLGL